MGCRDQPRSVTRDATLDAFATSQESADADEPSETRETSEGEGGGEEGSDEGTQAIEVTTDWTPAGATCAACGATVERRWQHQGALVCSDCKNWREQ